MNSRVAISIQAGKLRQSVTHYRHHSPYPLPLSKHTTSATISATTVVKLCRHGDCARSGYATRTEAILPLLIGFKHRTLSQIKKTYAHSVTFEVRFEVFVAVNVRTIEESSATEMEMGSFETSVPIYHTAWYASQCRRHYIRFCDFLLRGLYCKS